VQLDPKSLLIALLAMHLLYMVLELGMWLRRRDDDALAFWAFANALVVVAAMCFGMRNAWPYVVTVSLGNAALLGAWMAIWAGMRRFSQRSVPLFSVIALPLLLGTVLQFTPGLHHNYVARVIIAAVAWVVGLLLIVFECARAERVERLVMRRALMVAFLLLACFVLTRAGLSLLGPPSEDRMLVGQLAIVTFFVNMLIGTTWNLGLLMMVNEQLEARLRWTADRDGLTNLLNRRGFHELSQRVLQRARRDRAPVSLLLMDLDYFKTINDQYGHDVGDHVLCVFSQVAQQAIRPADILARYGGEEFCALLPNASEDEAMAVAERLRRDFAKTDLPVEGRSFSATVSIGAVEIDPDENIDQALRRADAALYLAKTNGRDRVEPRAPVPRNAIPAVAG
jgi:diguanylate cyclase (GGDEF)-like protein